MARIRSVKPEFWDDELMGRLSRDARLLYIGTWNLADDEGRLRWSASYLRSHLFMYDTDMDVVAVTALMKELVNAERITPYKVKDQWYGVVPRFRDHQKPNRPVPSKLPDPSLSTHEQHTEDAVSPQGVLTPVVEGLVVEGLVVGEERAGRVAMFPSTSTTNRRVNDALTLAHKYREAGA